MGEYRKLWWTLLAVLAVLWGVYFAAFAGHAPIY